MEQCLEVISNASEKVKDSLLLQDLQWFRNFPFLSLFLKVFRCIELISSNKLYDPLLDLNKVAGGTLKKDDEAMTWIENFSAIQERGKRGKKRTSVIGGRGGTRLMRVSPQLMSKESMALPSEVVSFHECD